MVRIENFTIGSAVGNLEGLLNVPDADSGRVAVICHPHPLYGGTMHNNVVYHTAQALRELGFVVLRFNFRGVGKSAGSYDHGRGEQDDVRAALAIMNERFPGHQQWIAGFSFGSWVGLQVGCQEPAVKAMLAVGMPVGHNDFSFLKTCGRPLAVVQGTDDPFGDVAAVREELVGTRSRLEVVEGGGHFFPGAFDALREAVTRGAEWLQQEVERGA